MFRAKLWHTVISSVSKFLCQNQLTQWLPYVFYLNQNQTNLKQKIFWSSFVYSVYFGIKSRNTNIWLLEAFCLLRAPEAFKKPKADKKCKQPHSQSCEGANIQDIMTFIFQFIMIDFSVLVQAHIFSLPILFCCSQRVLLDLFPNF